MIEQPRFGRGTVRDDRRRTSPGVIEFSIRVWPCDELRSDVRAQPTARWRDVSYRLTLPGVASAHFGFVQGTFWGSCNGPRSGHRRIVIRVFEYYDCRIMARNLQRRIVARPAILDNRQNRSHRASHTCAIFNYRTPPFQASVRKGQPAQHPFANTRRDEEPVPCRDRW